MQTKINIRPGVGMLGLFPSMNYRAWYALAELVDNAIDSYLHNKSRLVKAEGRDYRLRVVIEVDPKDGGFIRVWDDAAGIAAKDYQRAFVTAEAAARFGGTFPVRHRDEERQLLVRQGMASQVYSTASRGWSKQLDSIRTNFSRKSLQHNHF